MNRNSTEARRAGRPRNEAAASMILGAARMLVIEHGYENVTTAMIARAAGASKQTLYRRWKTKAELVLAAFLEYAQLAIDAKRQTSAVPLEQQVCEFLQRTFAALEFAGPAVRSLMAYAQEDAGFREVFRTCFIEPRRSALRGVLRAGSPPGTLDAEIEAAAAMLYGAVWYRLLLDEELGHELSARIAKLVCHGLASGGEKND